MWGGEEPAGRLLKAHGVQAREIAQEHSGVPTMWARLTQPRYLVYLEVSREVAAQRLDQGFTPGEWEALCSRLAHARQHADLVVDTDGLTPRKLPAGAGVPEPDITGNPLHSPKETAMPRYL